LLIVRRVSDASPTCETLQPSTRLLGSNAQESADIPDLKVTPLRVPFSRS